MRASKVILAAGLFLSGCSDITQKGTVDIRGRGAVLLTQHGDQLMETGVYAKRSVSKDFAEGYAKGESDQVKKEYWSLQDAQRWVHLWCAVRK